MTADNNDWVKSAIINLVLQLMMYGIDQVVTKLRGTHKLRQAISDSILELSKTNPEYSEISANLGEMFTKRSLPPHVTGELLVNVDFNNLVSLFRQTEFYKTYCDPQYLTDEKIINLLTQFLRILEQKVLDDPELRQEFYFARLLNGIQEITVAFQRPNVFIQINNITIEAPALKEERLNKLTAIVKLASEYCNQEKYDLAIEEYERYLGQSYAKEHPDYWKALNNIAKCLIEIGKVNEALPFLEDANTVRPGELDVMTNLGIAYLRLRKFVDAENTLKTVIEKFPGKAHSAYNSYGVVLAEQNKTKVALEEVEKAIAIKQDESGYYMNKGSILSNMGEHEKAISAYEKALSIDSKNPVYYLQMGSAYLLKHYKIGPVPSGKTQLIRFAVLRTVGDPLKIGPSEDVDKALTCFQKAIQLGAASTDPEFVVNTAFCYIGKGEFDKAEKLMKSICTKDLDTDLQVMLRLNLMHLYAWTDKLNNAEKMYDELKSTLTNSNLANLKRTMGSIYLFARQYEKALPLLEEASVEETDVRLLTNVGVCLSEMRRYSEAIEFLLKAIELDKKNATCYWDVAVCYYMQNMFGHAAVYFAKARELEPDIQRPNISTAVSFLHAGHWSAAEAELSLLLLEPYSDKPLLNGLMADLQNAIGNQILCRKHLVAVLDLVPKYSHNYYVAKQRFIAYLGYDPTR